MIYIFSFVLMISMPLIFMDNESTYSRIENRMLKEKPRLISDGRINIDISKDIDSYVNDRLGFKKYFNITNNIINFRILHAKNNTDVLVGKDGWLFYIRKDDGNNLDDFKKTNLFDESTLSILIRKIEMRVRWCEENDIKFILLIAPNKHTIYPEYYSFSRPEGQSRTDQVINNLPYDIKNNIIFPRDYLLAKKQESPLYFETDTHWNSQGAFHVYELLFDKIRSCFPDIEFPVINNFSRRIRKESGGDLACMLGLESFMQRTEIDIEPEGGWEAYYTYLKNDAKRGFVTENIRQNLPKVIIFRDSFFEVMEPFVSSTFPRAEYIWGFLEEKDKEHILAQKPDIIICEVVERYIQNIITSDWG
ncbi:MAG: hypothetical protein LBE13_17470 [Bacteroidales bacterium]|jgi:hypothetical protein|nr:hypothetical protein [Bacteroidales bacterium]